MYQNDDSRVNQVTIDLCDYSAAQFTQTVMSNNVSLEKENSVEQEMHNPTT